MKKFLVPVLLLITVVGFAQQAPIAIVSTSGTTRLTSTLDSARLLAQDNDIIYSTVRPALRHYGIIKNLPDNIVVSTGFAVFRMKNTNLSIELIYSFLTDEKTISFLQAKAEMSVSTYPSVTSDDILNLDFVLPSEEILHVAKDIFKYKDDFINLKNKENQKLTELKDLLLSKLTTVKIKEHGK